MDRKIMCILNKLLSSAAEILQAEINCKEVKRDEIAGIDLNSIPGISADRKKNVYWEKEGKKIWQDTHTKEFHWDGLTRGEEIELIGNGLWEWIRRYGEEVK